MKFLALLLAIFLSISIPDKHRPHDVRIKVVVPQDVVGLTVEVEDAELNYYRASSQQTREGVLAYYFDFRGVPGGEVHAAATVRTRTGKESSSPVTTFYMP